MIEFSNGSHIKIDSPCVRNCCLDEDDICMSCFRSIEEIMNWQNSTEDEKKKILNLCLIRKQNNSN